MFKLLFAYYETSPKVTMKRFAARLKGQKVKKRALMELHSIKKPVYEPDPRVQSIFSNSEVNTTKKKP